MPNTTSVLHCILFGLLALGFTFGNSLYRQHPGSERMEQIAENISIGAMAFLKAEYRILSIFVLSIALLLLFGGLANPETSSPFTAISFILGAFCSALAGFIGMRVATKANVRTTHGARTSLGEGLKIAFAGGTVMGMGVVGSGSLA